jgi:riboflavin synthase
MFTGIIEELGRVKAVEKKPGITVLGIEGKTTLQDAKIGDSITVNGTCLTMTGIKNDSFFVDISSETLKSTNLGDLVVGSRVNLERSMKVSDRIGGHLVTGHVDGVGVIKEKRLLGDSTFFRIEAPEYVLKYIILKGSIAVDGISLTVTDITDKDFGVVIIPHTANVTTMGFKGIGDKVNLEADILGKLVLSKVEGYVEKILLSGEKGGITLDFLKGHGFL